MDEYSIFKDVLGATQASNPQWYAQLTSHLSENQGKALTEVITLANQRVAAKESKVIEQQGGELFRERDERDRKLILTPSQVISSLKLRSQERSTLAHRQPLPSANREMPAAGLKF